MLARHRTFERLIEIGDDIIDIFNPDTQSYEIGCNTGFKLLIFRKLLVCGCCRMYYETFCITYICQVAEKLKAEEVDCVLLTPA